MQDHLIRDDRAQDLTGRWARGPANFLGFDGVFRPANHADSKFELKSEVGTNRLLYLTMNGVSEMSVFEDLFGNDRMLRNPSVAILVQASI